MASTTADHDHQFRFIVKAVGRARQDERSAVRHERSGRPHEDGGIVWNVVPAFRGMVAIVEADAKNFSWIGDRQPPANPFGRFPICTPSAFTQHCDIGPHVVSGNQRFDTAYREIGKRQHASFFDQGRDNAVIGNDCRNSHVRSCLKFGAGQEAACQPPSTNSVWPETKSDAADARKMAGPVMSSGVA